MWNYLFTGEGENRFDSQLLECIREKSNEQMETTLRDVKSLCTAVDDSGFTLLHYAAECGNETITQLLLKSGAKVDLQNKKGQTPLILATKGEHEETIRVLLEHDADIYLGDEDGISALQFVVHETLILPSIIEMFLTQLKIDCSDGKEMAERLLKVKCPLYVAVRMQKTELVKHMLSEGSPIDATEPKSNQAALHVAVQNRDVEMVKLLVDGGADVNALDVHKQTPLSLIRTFEETKILDILMNSKIELTACNEDGFMQMYWVLAKGTREAVKIAVQSGIDLRTKDSHDRTGIHYLANNANEGIIEIVRKWVYEAYKKENKPGRVKSFINALEPINSEIGSNLVDWNARDKDGRTPLHNAMAAGNTEFVRYLIKVGAEVNVKTANGVTLFFEAFESESSLEQRVECVKLIMEKGAYPDIEVERYLELHNTKSAINRDFPLIEPVLAHLVLRQAKGERISEKIFESIDCHPKLKDFVASCKEELDQMKSEKIDRSVTMLDFVATADAEEKIAFCKRHSLKLDELMKKCTSDSYYSRIAQRHYSTLCYLLLTKDVYLGMIAVLYSILVLMTISREFDEDLVALSLGFGVALHAPIITFTMTCFQYLKWLWTSISLFNWKQVAPSL